MSPDVVVVGGGLEGASIAWALTRRDVTDVTVYERHTVGSGATGKSSGVVRCHYGVPSLAAMAWRSLDFFEQAADAWGDDIGFRQTGYVVGVGPSNVEALEANLAMHRRLGIEVDSLPPDRVAELWPGLRVDDFAAFGYEPRGGYADAYRTAQAFAAAARQAGVVIRQSCAVVKILTDGDSVRGVLLADGEEVHTGSVVLAAGPWSPPLLAPLGLDLPVSAHREPILLVTPGEDRSAVPVLSDLVSLQYVRAEPHGSLLLGNSDLSTLDLADPDSYRDSAEEPFVERAVDRFLHRFPGLPEAAITTTYAGCYDVTPDFNPVISRTPVAGLVVAAGFSGHGFKLSPAVGTLVADLVCDGFSSDADVDERCFRFSRFAEGRPLSSPHPYVGAGALR